MPALPGVEDRIAGGRSERATRETSVSLALSRIRGLIVDGRMAPGSWIVEDRLCERLEMSRTPVRLALNLLRSEGFVIEQGNRRKPHMVVAPITREDAGDLYPILGRLEGLAGRRAAQLPEPERTLLAAELQELNDRLAGMIGEGLGAGTEIFEAHHAFHRLLVEAGSGARLKALHRTIELQAERYWRAYSAAILHHLDGAVQEHHEIVAALIAGDANLLESAILLNWENGRNRLAKAIEMFGEKGSW